MYQVVNGSRCSFEQSICTINNSGESAILTLLRREGLQQPSAVPSVFEAPLHPAEVCDLTAVLVELPDQLLEHGGEVDRSSPGVDHRGVLEIIVVQGGDIDVGPGPHGFGVFHQKGDRRHDKFFELLGRVAVAGVR